MALTPKAGAWLSLHQTRPPARIPRQGFLGDGDPRRTRHIPRDGRTVAHALAEDEHFRWGNEVLLGCNRETMRAGEMFVLFLTWNERVHAFMPMGRNTLLANITSGEVAPIRASFTAGPIVTAANGQPAAQYVRSLKAALANPR